MKVRVISVGAKMPTWVEQGCQEYLKRLPKGFTVDFVPISLGYRKKKNAKVLSAIEEEGSQILAALKSDEFTIALDKGGINITTEQLSVQLSQWRDTRTSVAVLIGGPDGLDPRCLKKANEQWSLSGMTLPHPLVRILLCEQLYRAWTITQNHPYHK